MLDHRGDNLPPFDAWRVALLDRLCHAALETVEANPSFVAMRYRQLAAGPASHAALTSRVIRLKFLFVAGCCRHAIMAT
jgi:hypothetical protein